MKHYKPTTPSRRSMTSVSYKKSVSTPEPHKQLTKGRKRASGRSSSGRISVRHKGGGRKRLWRMVDFQYAKKDIPARIEHIEYDPNRTAFIARVLYRDGERRYHLVPENMKPGDTLITSKNAEPSIGSRLPLSLIPVGVSVYNVETYPNGGARLIRSAGNTGEVMAHDEGYTLVKLPSGAIRKINGNAWASVGQVSNSEHGQVVFGKAGRSRWHGIRPTVRGSAMNPVDHPYGGGEGRAPQGMARSKNKWGKGARGSKTRKSKRYSDSLIIKGRKKKKR